MRLRAEVVAKAESIASILTAEGSIAEAVMATCAVARANLGATSDTSLNSVVKEESKIFGVSFSRVEINEGFIDVTVDAVFIVKGIGLTTVVVRDNSTPLLKSGIMTVVEISEVIDDIGLIAVSIADDSKDEDNVDIIEVYAAPSVGDMNRGSVVVAVTVISAVMVVGFINETVTVIVFCEFRKDCIFATAEFDALVAVADTVAVAAPAAAPAAPAAEPAAPVAPTGPG